MAYRQKILVAWVLLLSTSMASAFGMTLPKEARVPGGVALVHLPIASNQNPLAYYGGSRVMVAKHNSAWVAVVGIPLSAAVGEHHVVIKAVKPAVNVSFQVEEKEYEKQYIKINNKRKVNPNKMDMTRINKERALIQKALRTWTEPSSVVSQLVQPVSGRLSSSFGLRRFFNEQPRKPHGGIDIAAPTGSIIKAPASGIVVGTGHYFFNGKTVFVDHGQGLITLYCHLDNIHVKPGQSVKTGDPLGTVGKTGRATGPHLHWGVSLNNTKVDPALFTR